MSQPSETSVENDIGVRLSTLTRDWYNLVSFDRDKSEDGRHPSPRRTTRKPRQFCTGSTYMGQTDLLGFSGRGTYTYPHGVKYEGHFFDGHFEGEGCLIYPNGYRVLGEWRKGKMVSYRFFFEDGLEVTHPWTFLDFPDRMYHGEGEEFYKYAEDAFDNVSLGEDLYDTRDGVYNPHTKCVHDKYLRIIRIVTPQEERQITNCYRATVGRHVGYKPELYECWTSGEKREIDNIQKQEEDEADASELTLFNPCANRDSL